MQNFFKIRDAKKSCVCGKHLGHVPSAPYTPTHTPFTSHPHTVSGWHFGRNATSGPELWTVHQRWIAILSLEYCGGSTKIGARKKTKHLKEGEDFKRVHQKQTSRYKRHKVCKVATSKPCLFHLLNIYWTLRYASGTGLGPKDRDEQKTWPVPHEAYHLSEKTLSKWTIMETHRTLRR